MAGSLKRGRFQVRRSMRWRVGWGVGVEEGEVGREERRDSIVEVTKAPIWGQTRGCLVEQRMTPIEGGGVGNDMAEILLQRGQESENGEL